MPRLNRTNVFVASVIALAFVAGLVLSGANVVTARYDSPEVTNSVETAKQVSLAFRAASDRVMPAVVAIETKSTRPVRHIRPNADNGPQDPFGGVNPFKGTPFEDLFKEFPGLGEQFRGQPGVPHGAPQQPRRGSGLGSGVIIDRSGIILTNNHVVANSDTVTVRLHDGREFEAVDVWTDPKTDIAVVRIEADNLVAAETGDSDKVEVGDWVLALGQPFGLRSTVTAGIISAKHRGIGITARENFLQTDAAINPGNSGGPLVNLDGEVIGINTAISSRGGGNDGIGFAVPINLARWAADQLASTGSVKRAYLGVGIQGMTAELAKQLGVEPRLGVVVTQVYPDTPAAKAGLQDGDVIVKFDGQEITSPQVLQVAVERAELARKHTLSVVRDGKEIELTVVAEEQPSQFGATEKTPGQLAPGTPSGKLWKQWGLDLSALDKDVARKLGLEGVTGVVITDVRPDSPAAEAGLESGAVITKINRKPVSDLDQARKLLESSEEDEVLLLVRTGEGSRFVVLRK